MRGSSQHGLDHTNTRPFLGCHKHGERRATPHPSHGGTRPTQPCAAPLPCPSRGPPERGDSAGPRRAPWGGGSGGARGHEHHPVGSGRAAAAAAAGSGSAGTPVTDRAAGIGGTPGPRGPLAPSPPPGAPSRRDGPPPASFNVPPSSTTTQPEPLAVEDTAMPGGGSGMGPCLAHRVRGLPETPTAHRAELPPL